MSTRESPILICYDRSEGARRAIEMAGALFPGRRAVVLYVWSPLSVMIGGYGAVVPLPAYDDSELHAAAQEIAEQGASIARASGLDARPDSTATTLDGTPRTILEVADQQDAGLIVMGARGLSTFKSMLLGSVSHAVVQHAHRPVLVVPPPAHTEEGVLPAEPEHASANASS
jgi:nucleotide-binding universal stress UspA family protein